MYIWMIFTMTSPEMKRWIGVGVHAAKKRKTMEMRIFHFIYRTP
jgi:hypothetical protein